MVGEWNVRVLIVDDDAAIRQTLRSALEDEAYGVLEARDGLAALGTLRESVAPLIALLDLRMPVMDGMRLLRVVDEDKALARRHRFIIVTANQDSLKPDDYALLDRFSAPVIPKPFDLDELLNAVEMAAIRLDPGAAGNSASAHPPRG
jgi:CheY-like chemotaxis protein